jgi:hypothetical protein
VIQGPISPTEQIGALSVLLRRVNPVLTEIVAKVFLALLIEIFFRANMEAIMNDFSYVTDANVKRFRNLLETSLNDTERQAIQRMLTEELAKAALPKK